MNKKNLFRQKLRNSLISNLFNKTKEIIAFLNMSLRVIFNVIRWPIMGLRNILSYAFENHYLQSVSTEIKGLSFNETIKVIVVLFIWPFVGLWNIISYAFIQNHFIRTLISDLIDRGNFDSS